MKAPGRHWSECVPQVGDCVELVLEQDRECEAVFGSFLRQRHGALRFPVDTDDLRSLIEE